jgi:hypothetical protein
LKRNGVADSQKLIAVAPSQENLRKNNIKKSKKTFSYLGRQKFKQLGQISSKSVN